MSYEKNPSIITPCMMIGHMFKQKWMNDETEEWSASAECATVAKLTLEIMKITETSIGEALDIVMDIVMRNGFRNIEEHNWDDYTIGFIAGEMLGLPTVENFRTLQKAIDIWINDINCNYHYFQEVIEKVKEGK